MLKTVTVFCGSASGVNPAYAEGARELAAEIARRKIRLVYGGASVGLMGIMADTVIEAGAEVVGVMPRYLLDKEVAHTGLTELLVVESMHERKGKMGEMADAFITLPGGLGTLEEFFEVVSWAQLGLHTKPCVLFNIAGYFDALIELLDLAVAQGFFKQVHRELILVAHSPAEVLSLAENYKSTVPPRWAKLGPSPQEVKRIL